MPEITPYWNRMTDLDTSMPVEVYRNTHKKGVVYTIRQGGYVVAHADEINLINAEFYVSEAGRKRVKKTGHKNVHAWIRGEIVLSRGEGGNWFEVEYDPRKYKTFVRTKTKKPVLKGAFVSLNQHGVFVDNTANL